MGSNPSNRRLKRLMKSLDDEDREHLLAVAERLAGDEGDAPESLNEGDPLPSYQAAAGRDMYEAKKRQKEHKERVWGSNATDK